MTVKSFIFTKPAPKAARKPKTNKIIHRRSQNRKTLKIVFKYIDHQKNNKTKNKHKNTQTQKHTNTQTQKHTHRKKKHKKTTSI